MRGEYDSALVAAYLFKRRTDVDAIEALIVKGATDNVFQLYGRHWAYIKCQDGVECCWQGWDRSRLYDDPLSVITLPTLEAVIAWVLIKHW